MAPGFFGTASVFGPGLDLPYRGVMTKTNGIKGMAAVLSLSACMATVGVDARSIPTDAAQTCARHCQTIGMRLSAVAIMAENVGCVCQPPGRRRPAPRPPANLVRRPVA
jgi:hypothetical protein